MIDSTELETSSPPHFPPENEPGRGIARAAVVLAVGNVASRIIGLARETVKANLFGASGLLSAFEVAAYVPTSLFDLIVGGMVSSSLVPVFSDFAAKEKREALWQVVSTVLSVATAVLLIVVGLVEVFAPQVAWLVGANEFTDPVLTSTSIRLMRIVTPAVLFLGTASILTASLYALKRFNLPAFIGALFNGSVVLVALLRPDDIESLAWGVLLGAFLQVLVQLLALRDARLRWQFNWRHPAIRRILKLYAPIIAGLVINQLAVALSLNLATRTGDQSVSYMNFATRLIQFPLGLVVTATSIAILPTLSSQSGQMTEFKQTLAEGLRLVITLILPATLGLFAMAAPMVAILFEHGQFTPADTQVTALVLRLYLLGLPFIAVDQMLVFASYARKDTWRPAAVGVVSIIVYSATAVLLLNSMGLFSLMIADTVKHIVHTICMLWLMKRHLGGLSGYQIRKTAIKSFLAAILTGGTAFLTLLLIENLNLPGGFKGNLIRVAGGSGIGLIVFAGTAALLKFPETQLILGRLRKRPFSTPT